MSGHSKWHSIKHKKGAADAARGKVFTRHAKLIAIAARDGGGDPSLNPSLRLAIDNAKADNMPNLNIERAIKKGTGEDKEGANFVEAEYEGYAPGGVAVLVSTLSDNKNRTVANIRAIFSKNGGNLGESGSVGFLFNKRGIIVIDNPSDEIEMISIEAGAEDVQSDGSILEVITEPKQLFHVKKTLEEGGAAISNAEIRLIPATTVAINDEETAKKIVRLMQLLEDDDDVSNVAANFEIPDELLERIMQ